MLHNSFKVTKHHAVKDIGELQPGSFDEENYCPTHPRHILDAWDKDCCLLTCGKCRLREHAGHDVQDFEEVAETSRKEVAALAIKVKTAFEKQGAQVTKMGTDFQSIEERCNIVTERITHTFHDMDMLFKQKEKKLQIEVQQYKEKVREILTQKRRRCQSIEAILDYINKALRYSSRHDMVTLGPILQRETEEWVRSRMFVPQSPPLPKFNTDGLEKIKSVLSQSSIISTKNDSDIAKGIREKGRKTTDSLSRECEVLKKTLNELKNENQALKEKLNRREMEAKQGPYRLAANVIDISYLLHCPSVEFSKTMYNAGYVHVTDSETCLRSHFNRRLKNYHGTTSTNPLPIRAFPQYFEVQSQVDVDKLLTESNLLLEIGLAREEEQDQSHCISGKPNTYSLNVAYCNTLRTICSNVWRQRMPLMRLLDTLENTPGSSVELHHGVVYDSARSRIAFLDIKKERIISRVRNIKSSVTYWPMFGVYNSHLASVSMTLVVGSRIDMTESKKALILKSLY